MRKGKKRIDYLKKIGVSEYLIHMAQGEILHEFLDSYENPKYIYKMKNVPTNITPLWEIGYHLTAIVDRNNTISFVEFSLEDIEETFELIGFTEQAPLSRLFLDAIEVSSLEDYELITQIEEASICTGFEYSGILVDLLKQNSSGDGEYFDNFHTLQKKTDW